LDTLIAVFHRDHAPEPKLQIVTSAANSTEAAIIVGDLQAAGIAALDRMGAPLGSGWRAGSRDIYVKEDQLAQARELLAAEPMSEEELVRAEEEAASQVDPPV
jgi:hypothetical protein